MHGVPMPRPTAVCVWQVFEELDSPDEWFYNETTQKLYYFFNSTGNEEFVATRTKVLFNVTGSQEAPIRDFTVRSLEIRDTALTYGRVRVEIEDTECILCSIAHPPPPGQAAASASLTPDA